MSRLIVKNIPAYLNEDRLREHFSSQGAVVTDAKVIRRHDGTSRRFAFLGFKEDEEAREALKYFNRTFIDTCRIDVNVAKSLLDESQSSKSSTARAEQSAKEASSTHSMPPLEVVPDKRKEKAKKSKGVSFDEFMAIMAPKKKRKTWQNEEGEEGEGKLEAKDFEPDAPQATKKRKQIAAAGEGDAAATKKSNIEDEELKPDEAVHNEGMTDLEYMYKRMKRRVGEGIEVEDKKFDQSDSEEEGHSRKEGFYQEAAAAAADDVDTVAQKQEKAKLEEKARQDEEIVDAIMASGRLFVRNLPFEATEEDIEAYFAKYGQVTQAHITLDKASKKSKGIAFVTFQDPTHALAAFRSSDGQTFQGRLLHVMPAVQLRAGDREPVNVRDKKKQELKASATKDFNWSTLFMSADAVASSVANRLGIEKTDILNPEYDASGKDLSPAVRLALAETSVIQETKDYLEKEGINIDAFQGSGSKVQRSDTITLVKNIPFGTSSEVLKGLFEKHGKVERVVMPPSGTIAIVEMEMSGESKVAFKALAYKRLGNSVLYLEKAPLGIMVGPDRTPPSGQQLAALPIAEAAKDELSAADATATLFVKNLAFSTTDERLSLLFSTFEGFLFARIQRRPSKSGTAKLSMGYGFVGFQNADAAKRAQQAKDKTTLDGHLLSVNFAERGHDEDDDNNSNAQGAEDGVGSSRGGAPTTKLIIKNLPFQASKKDVRSLFAAHGKLKSVRVPRKSAAGVIGTSGGSATGVRGFGFVEFVNRKEAENAYKSLRHTHLLGRHLVLEWDLQGLGSGGDQLEQLRKKTARGLQDVGIRKEKLHLNEEDIRAAARKDKERAEEDDDDVDVNEEELGGM